MHVGLQNVLISNRWGGRFLDFVSFLGLTVVIRLGSDLGWLIQVLLFVFRFALISATILRVLDVSDFDSYRQCDFRLQWCKVNSATLRGLCQVLILLYTLLIAFDTAVILRVLDMGDMNAQRDRNLIL